MDPKPLAHGQPVSLSREPKVILVIPVQIVSFLVLPDLKVTRVIKVMQAQLPQFPAQKDHRDRKDQPVLLELTQLFQGHKAQQVQTESMELMVYRPLCQSLTWQALTLCQMLTWQGTSSVR